MICMGQNVGMTDRIIRIILAVVFIILALTIPGKYSAFWFIPAVLALVTGIVGYSGLYSLFKWNTAKVETKSAKVAPAKKAAKKKKK